MLYISFYKEQENEVVNPNAWMIGHTSKLTGVFDDPYVKKLIKAIDKTECYAMYNMKSPILGGINYNQLSTGVKNLIIAYWFGLPIDGAMIGDNCIPYLIEMSIERDIYVTVYGIMKFRQDFDAIVLNSDSPCPEIHTLKDWLRNINYYD
jgi:hypothetical protein